MRLIIENGNSLTVINDLREKRDGKQTNKAKKKDEKEEEKRTDRLNSEQGK